MKITICGGGNLGHVVAGFLAAQPEIEVRMLTRRPEQWSDTLIVTDPHGKVFNGKLSLVTSNVAAALDGVDIVLLCLPGFSIRQELEKIKEHIPAKAFVGSVVSSTGFFFQAFDVLSRNQPLFGFQRVPFISRTVEYGHEAAILGYKKELKIAVEQTTDGKTFSNLIASLFDCPTELLNSHYEVSLTNSNPLLHTSRLYSLWNDYKPGETKYPNIPMFYSDWDSKSAEILINMDLEFQALLKTLPVSDRAIPPILEYYESYDAKSLAAKIRSIEAFKGLSSPMIKSEDGWVPDFSSRYFTEDFPYGLRFIKELNDKKGIEAPWINEVYNWGIEVIGENAY